MQLTVTRQDGDRAGTPIAALALRGSIDISNRRDVVEVGQAALSEGRSLAMDLAEIEFMDSSGIGALVALSKASQRLGRTFELTAASARVRRILEVTGLACAWSRSE